MWKRVGKRARKLDIYVRGLGFVKVVESALGIIDADGNIYQRQPDFSYVSVLPEEKKVLSEIDHRTLKPYQTIVLDDGSTWRYQPDENDKFNLVLVAKPKYFKTLSPNDPSRHGKHSKNSK